MLVVQVSHGLAERLDASRRAILSARHGDVNGGGALEAALDLIVNLGGNVST